MPLQPNQLRKLSIRRLLNLQSPPTFANRFDDHRLILSSHQITYPNSYFLILTNIKYIWIFHDTKRHFRDMFVDTPPFPL